MKDFLKFTLATVVGILLTGVVFFVLSVVVLTGIIAGSETETNVHSNSVFVLSLDGIVSERKEHNPLETLLPQETSSIGLEDVLKSIRKAKDHKDIKGIYLEAGNLSASFASLQAIRRELTEFKKTGKFVIAYGGNYSQSTYYLASAADKVYLNPIGNVSWQGLSSEIVFLKDLLKKAGIQMQVFKVGTYKSAVEPFTSTEMSEANREQTQVFLNSIWTQILNDVSASRKISIDSLNAYADSNLNFAQAKVYVDKKMVDGLKYQDEVLELLKKEMNIDSKPHTLKLEDMINVDSTEPKGKHGNLIAVYYASGEITDKPTSSYSDNGINAEDMTVDLRELRENEAIKAVVLRVNSPGGSGFASEQIWREIMLLKEKKPVIVSMSDYAASGGYYISCAADSIFAEATTLTGSIGVFGMIPDVSELLTDKLGVRFDGVKTNQLSDMGSMGRPFNEAEKALVQQSIEDFYTLFVKRCAEGRKLPAEHIRKIAEGRVWTGATAKDLKLVDALGGLSDAVAAAAKKAGITEYTLTSSPEKSSGLFDFFDKTRKRYIGTQAEAVLGSYFQQLMYLKEIQDTDRIQARMPFFVTIR